MLRERSYALRGGLTLIIARNNRGENSVVGKCHGKQDPKMQERGPGRCQCLKVSCHGRLFYYSTPTVFLSRQGCLSLCECSIWKGKNTQNKAGRKPTYSDFANLFLSIMLAKWTHGRDNEQRNGNMYRTNLHTDSNEKKKESNKPSYLAACMYKDMPWRSRSRSQNLGETGTGLTAINVFFARKRRREIQQFSNVRRKD